MALENLIQKVGKTKSITNVDYKFLTGRVLRGKIDINGDEIISQAAENTNVNHIATGEMEQKFRKYKTADTKIAKFVRSLDADKEYSKE